MKTLNLVLVRYVYFVGIIDILIPYGARKAAEHAAKSVIHDSETISAVPPDQYAARFQNYMEKVSVQLMGYIFVVQTCGRTC